MIYLVARQVCFTVNNDIVINNIVNNRIFLRSTLAICNFICVRIQNTYHCFVIISGCSWISWEVKGAHYLKLICNLLSVLRTLNNCERKYIQIFFCCKIISVFKVSKCNNNFSCAVVLSIFYVIIYQLTVNIGEHFIIC